MDEAKGDGIDPARELRHAVPRYVLILLSRLESCAAGQPGHVSVKRLWSDFLDCEGRRRKETRSKLLFNDELDCPVLDSDGKFSEALSPSSASVADVACGGVSPTMEEVVLYEL